MRKSFSFPFLFDSYFARLTIELHMGRVFNIRFQDKGKTYTALVSVNGKDDARVNVITNHDSIEIILPTGRLIFSISEVLYRLYASTDKMVASSSFYVTPNISLQLMNTDW